MSQERAKELFREGLNQGTSNKSIASDIRRLSRGGKPQSLIDEENTLFENSLIQQYRQTDEGKSDTRTNKEITFAFGQELRSDPESSIFEDIAIKHPQFKTDFLTIQNEQSEGLISEVGQGLSSGIEGTKGVLKAGGALIADVIPGDVADPLRDSLLESARGNFQAAIDEGPTVKSIDDIRPFGEGGVTDFLRFFAGAAGQTIPSGVEAIAAGGLGGFVAKAGIKKFAKDALREHATKKVKKDLGEDFSGEILEEAIESQIDRTARTIGQTGSTIANSWTMSSGEIFAELSGDPEINPDTARNIALSFGAIAAAPDTILPSIVLNKFNKLTDSVPTRAGKKEVVEGMFKQVGDKMDKRFGTRVMKDGFVGAFAEGPTEAFQEYINILSSKVAKGEDLEIDDHDYKRIRDAAALGAIGGITIGGITGIPSPRFTDTTNNQTREDINNSDKSSFDNIESQFEEDIPTDEQGQELLSPEEKEEFFGDKPKKRKKRNPIRFKKPKTPITVILPEKDGDPTQVILSREPTKEDEAKLEQIDESLEQALDIKIQDEKPLDDAEETISEQGVQTPISQNKQTPETRSDQSDINQRGDLGDTEKTAIKETGSASDQIETEADQDNPTAPRGEPIPSAFDEIEPNVPLTGDQFVEKWANFEDQRVPIETREQSVRQAYNNPGTLVKPNPNNDSVFLTRTGNDLVVIQQVDQAKNEWAVTSPNPEVSVLNTVFNSKDEAFQATQRINESKEATQPDPEPITNPELSSPVKEGANPRRGKNIDTSTVPLKRADDRIKQIQRTGKSKSDLPRIKSHAGRTVIALSKDGKTYVTRAFRNKRKNGPLLDSGWRVEIDREESIPGYVFNPKTNKANPDLKDLVDDGWVVIGDPFELSEVQEQLFVELSDGDFSQWYQANLGSLARERDSVSDINVIFEKFGQVAPEKAKGLLAMSQDAVNSIPESTVEEIMAGVFKSVSTVEGAGKLISSKNWDDFLAKGENGAVSRKSLEDFELILNAYAHGHVDNARNIIAGEDAVNRRDNENQAGAVDQAVAIFYSRIAKSGELALADMRSKGRTLFESLEQVESFISDDKFVAPNDELSTDLRNTITPDQFNGVVSYFIENSGKDILDDESQLQDETDILSEEIEEDLYSLEKPSVLDEKSKSLILESIERRVTDERRKYIEEEIQSGKTEEEIEAVSYEILGKFEEEVRRDIAERISKFVSRLTVSSKLAAQVGNKNWANDATRRYQEELANNGNELAFSKGLNQDRVSNSEIRGKFQFVKNTLQSLGVDVSQLESNLETLFDGVYDQNNRTVTLIMEDIMNPTNFNLQTITHELAHVIFRDLPSHVQESIRKGINDLYTSGKLRYNQNTSIDNAKSPEIRLEELLAASVENSGFTAGESRSISRKIIRLMKGWMLTAAQAVANLLGLDSISNQLAVSWFNNRMESAVNGDGTYSLWNELGAIPFKNRDKLNKEEIAHFGDEETASSLMNKQPYHRSAPMDSPESIQFNIDRDIHANASKIRQTTLANQNVAFSGAVNPGDIDNPEVIFHKVIAGVNHVERLKNSIGVEIETNPEFNDIVAGYNTRVGVQLPNGQTIQPKNGLYILHDATSLKTKADTVNRIAQANPSVPINPEFVPEMFASEDLRDISRENAYKTMEKELSNLDQFIVKQDRDIETRKNNFQNKEETYKQLKSLDTSEHITNLRKTLTKDLREFKRTSLAVGQYKGRVMEQIKQLDNLDTTALVRKYRASLNKLGDRGFANKFFDYIDTVIEEIGYDPKLTVTELRDRINQSIDASPLSDSSEILSDLVIPNSPDSTVTLSAVASFLKTDLHQANRIKLRRLKSAEDRLSIAAELDSVYKASEEIADQIIELSKHAKENGSMYQSIKQARRDYSKAKRDLRNAERNKKVSEFVRSKYEQELSELGGSLNYRGNFVVKNNVEYFVAPSVDATPDQIRANSKTLKLTDKNELTSKKELEDHLKQNRLWMEKQQANQTDNTVLFNIIQDQTGKLADFNGKARTALKDANTNFISRFIDGIGQRLGSTGLINGQRIEKLFNQYSATLLPIANTAQKIGREADNAKAKLDKAILKRKGLIRQEGLTLSEFKTIDSVVKIRWEREEGIFEDVEAGRVSPEDAANRIMDKVYKDLEQNVSVGKYFKGRKSDLKQPLRRYIDTQWDNSKFFFEHNEKIGIKTLIPIRREGIVGAIRGGRKQSLRMFSRSMNSDVRIAHTTMTDTDRIQQTWSTFSQEVESIRREFIQAQEEGAALDLQVLSDRLNKYFVNKDGSINETIRDVFMEGLASNSVTSVFNSPTSEFNSEATIPADTDKVREAWQETKEEGGSVIDFIVKMNDSHGGNVTNLDAFIVDSLQNVARVWNVLSDTFETNDKASQSYASLVPSFQIESRTIGPQFPESFQEYIIFGAIKNGDLAKRTAYQSAMGRDGSILESAMTDMRKEMESTLNEFNEFQSSLKRDGIKVEYSKNPKRKTVYERRMINHFGEKKYKNLKKLNSTLKNVIKEEENKLFQFFNGDTNKGVFGVDTTFMSAFSFVTSRMLSGPATAMLNYAEITASPYLLFGSSKLATNIAKSAVAFAARDVAGSVTQAMGVDLNLTEEERRILNEEGYGDLLINQDWRASESFNSVEALDDVNDNPYARFFRQINRYFNEFTVGKSGGDFTRLRLPFFGGFDASTISTSTAMTMAMWREVSNIVAKGVRVAKQDPAALERGLTAEDLGFTGLSADSFNKMESQFTQRYNIGSFTELVSDAMSRGASASTKGQSLLSPQTRALLASFASSEMVSVGGLSNFNLMFQTGIWRTVFLFMGWTLRRTSLLSKVMTFNTENEIEISKQVMGKAIGAMMLATIPSLAIVWLQDEYFERLLGKKRNKVGVDEAIGHALEGNFAAAGRGFLENAAYGGAYGLYGELANAMVNRVTGEGDARALSLDSRVVVLNSVASVFNSVLSTYQTGQLDYNKSVRPFMQAIGLNGMIQAEQIIINMTGADGGLLAPEAATVRRMNAQNHIAASSRNLEMDLKKNSFGGNFVATPLTAFSSKMERAAYNNDRALFVKLRDQAIRSLIEDKKASTRSEALRILKNNFARRHPITKVMARKITRAEFNKVLQNMPDHGRRAVKDAIAHYEAFARILGVKPYFNSKTSSSSLNLAQARGSLF